MDQLRTALVWLKRHHFWVLCGLVAIIALGSWAKASGKMDTLFGGNSSLIKAHSPRLRTCAKTRSIRMKMSIRSSRHRPRSNGKT